MGGDKPVRRCGTSRFFPPVGYRWKLDSLKARPPSRGTLARNPLPPPPSWNEKWLAREREACEELCEVEGGGGKREGGRERHDPFLQTSKFLPTTNYATPLASPSLVPPSFSRSQTPGTNATEWLSQPGTSVKSHLPWPLTSRWW